MSHREPPDEDLRRVIINLAGILLLAAVCFILAFFF